MDISKPDNRSEMSALIETLAPHEGYTQTRLANVNLMRANHPIGRTPVIYEPSIVIVCQGQKRGYLNQQIFHYDALHYLVLSVPLPFYTETDASEENPLLAISIDLDMTEISSLLIELEPQLTQRVQSALGIFSTPLDDALQNAALRLLRVLQSANEAKILGHSIIREIYYRVLIGKQGKALINALASQGNLAKMAQMLRYIHQHYAQTLEVSQLAQNCDMSIASFHTHFKAITGSSPLQYIKSVRLQQARLFMIRDNLTAAASAIKVGYESPSQFNREFKRAFGRTPGEEVKLMKQAFAISPAVSF